MPSKWRSTLRESKGSGGKAAKKGQAFGFPAAAYVRANAGFTTAVGRVIIRSMRWGPKGLTEQLRTTRMISGKSDRATKWPPKRAFEDDKMYAPKTRDLTFAKSGSKYYRAWSGEGAGSHQKASGKTYIEFGIKPSLMSALHQHEGTFRMNLKPGRRYAIRTPRNPRIPIGPWLPETIEFPSRSVAINNTMNTRAIQMLSEWLVTGKIPKVSRGR